LSNSLAGFPITVIPSETSFITTAPAPATALSPIVIFGNIFELDPI